MVKASMSRFKLVLLFTLILGLAVGAYILWTLVDFNSKRAADESKYLAKYTERAVSRYIANPQLLVGLDETHQIAKLGNEKTNMAFSYEQLQQRFPQIVHKNSLKNNHPVAFVTGYRGWLQTPNYVLVLPVKLSTGAMLYSYLIVDEQRNQEAFDMQVLEKAQPAIFIALISILFLVILELFHIGRMNTNINEFANWASKLSAGANSPDIPQFSSPKFNYMAYAIEKNLSGISEVLEQEQSFAKFTSHELRTPIAVLSANMEVLELMMKDLSPQERKVLKNMESAVSDMKYQMEALLWLSREGESHLDYAPCVLSELINKAIADNAYLTEGKNITTEVTVESQTIKTNPVFLQIVLNNLLRNAYQHMDSGKVLISLNSSSLVIENTGAQGAAKTSIGFGIGLVLVDKLVHKLGMGYEVELLPNGRRVKLEFRSAS